MLFTPRNIYIWLAQPVLDPTNSGHVTMDSLMKHVTTALEWSFGAKAPNVRAETLEDITTQTSTSQTDNEDQTSSTRSKPAASRDAVMDQKHPIKPQGVVLRFKSHGKRKTRIPNMDQRWARRETNWEVVGGESR